MVILLTIEAIVHKTWDCVNSNGVFIQENIFLI